MKHEVNDGFAYYIELLGDEDYMLLFQKKEYLQIVGSLTEAQSTYRYAPQKWSIKQIIGHMADHERVMMYRTLRFSRNDQTPLPGYDQNLLVENSRFDELPFSELLRDFGNVRESSISFIKSLSASQLMLSGIASQQKLTVLELLKATIGHELHHIMILKEKYSI